MKSPLINITQHPDRTLQNNADRGAQRSIPAGKNQLTSVTGTPSATFVYDGDGNRVKSTINTTTTAFVGNHTEWDVASSSLTRYYYAGSTRVAMRKNNTVYYLLSDHLPLQGAARGSTSVTTDQNGQNPVKQYYLPWGEVRYSSASLQTKYTYTGQYSNVSDFGLLFYNARWYDSALGRFISADTVVPQPGNPLDWDRYGYTRNNPVIYSDPTGHDICDEEGTCYDQGKLIRFQMESLDDACRRYKECRMAKVTYNALIRKLNHKPTVMDILKLTALAEGYSTTGEYSKFFIEGLARNFYEPENACIEQTNLCTQNRLFKFMSGFEPWWAEYQTINMRVTSFIDLLNNQTMNRTDLHKDISNILNRKFAASQGWTDGKVGSAPWQWTNWIRQPLEGEAIGFLYTPGNRFGKYFWILTADQDYFFKTNIKPNESN